MNTRTNRVMQLIAGAAMTVALTAAAQSAPTWSVGPIDISGSIDGYYSYNANNPDNLVNQNYNFNDKANQFSLNQAKLSFSHTADPVGVQVDLLFGNANRLISCSPYLTSLCGDFNYIEQAYVSFKPAKLKGFQADFGKFVTSAGAEVIETQNNWNYSRSLLFTTMLPYDHFGLRTSYPVTKDDTIGVQVVNGFNANVWSAPIQPASKLNNGVTFGFTNAYVKSKYAWYTNVYTGPQASGTQEGYRNLIDTTVTYNPTSKLSAYVNYDYVQERAKKSTLWDQKQGMAVAAKYQLDAKQAVAGRYEYTVDNKNSRATVQEITATYEYKFVEGLLTRVEYRRDWADQNYYVKGFSTPVKAQDTLTAGFVAFFGPKR